MSYIEATKHILEALSYLAVLIGVPIGLFQYIRTVRREQKDREYGTYDALDERYIEYLHLCFANPDLDIFDLPMSKTPKVNSEQARREMMAFTILISIFERAYLMYKEQRYQVIEDQWTGWLEYIESFCCRQNFRSSWLVAGQSFDVEFQAFMEETLLATSGNWVQRRASTHFTSIFHEPTETQLERQIVRISSPLDPRFLSVVEFLTRFDLTGKVASNKLAALLETPREMADPLLLLYAFEDQGGLAGAAILVFLPIEKTMVINSFAIVPSHRSLVSLQSYVSLLKARVSDLGLVNGSTLLELVKPSQAEIRLSRSFGFETLVTDYPYPLSESSELPALLLQRKSHGFPGLSPGHAIRLLYLRYHPYWHSTFPSIKTRFESFLRTRLQRLEKGLWDR